jgi:hypothetical protein
LQADALAVGKKLKKPKYPWIRTLLAKHPRRMTYPLGYARRIQTWIDSGTFIILVLVAQEGAKSKKVWTTVSQRSFGVASQGARGSIWGYSAASGKKLKSL